MIVAKLAGQIGFHVLPRRWVVEKDLVLDQPMPAHRPRLRTPTRAPRRHRPMVNDHRHDPADSPAITAPEPVPDGH
jgi:hypothetical protein